jgi:hypothetical protein
MVFKVPVVKRRKEIEMVEAYILLHIPLLLPWLPGIFRTALTQL